MSDEEAIYELSEETMRLLKLKKLKKDGTGCLLCSMIYSDFEKNRRLTDYPKDVFPVQGKLAHLKLERRIGD